MSAKEAILSQYLASLDMLREAVQKCPDALWDDRQYRNVFWHVAYHALFYTHLYLQPSGESFVPWAKDNEAYRSLRDVPVGACYRREELLEYDVFCRAEVRRQVDALDFEAPSGFHWLPMNKLELQVYNIRHLQQHVGELYERLGVAAGVDLPWVSRGRE